VNASPQVHGVVGNGLTTAAVGQTGLHGSLSSKSTLLGGTTDPGHNGSADAAHTGGMSGHASGVPAQGSARDEPIWRGNIRVFNQQSSWLVPSVAVKYARAGRPMIQSASSWPSSLVCITSVVKQQAELQRLINDPATQWFVRFLLLETPSRDVVQQVVTIMVQRQIGFEISCNEGNGSGGMLYLFGSSVEGSAPSLLGVYRPNTA
jgi:hypothetical protein